MPTEIDVVERRIRQLEIERDALRKETDEPVPGAPRTQSTRSWPNLREQSSRR